MSSGFMGRINMTFINDLKQILCPIIQEHLNEIKIQKIKIGKYLLQNTNIILYEFFPNNINVSLKEPNIIEINANKIKGGGYTEFKTKLIKENIFIEITEIIYTIQAQLTTSQLHNQLYPYITVINQEPQIHINIQFKGTISPIINIFHRQISNYIQKSIGTFIKTKIINLIDKGMTNIPKIINIKKNYHINYALIDQPFIKNNSIFFNSYCSLENKTMQPIELSLYESTIEEMNINIQSHRNKNICIYISEYVLNHSFNVLFISNQLEFETTQENIPQRFNFKLDTSWIGKIIENFIEKYKINVPVKLNIKICERPIVKCINDYIIIELPSKVKVSVLQHDDTYKQVIILETVFRAEVIFVFDDENKIGLTLKGIKLSKTKVIECEQKTVYGIQIELGFNLLSGSLINVLNNYIQKNYKYPIPIIDGMKIINGDIIHKDKYLIVDYDIVL